MCDTLAAVPPATADGAVWLAKNSDREPGEAQLLEHLEPRGAKPGARTRCTYVEVDAEGSFEVLLSRPAWMWGAEMGVNEKGVAIGNQAVFTRLSVAQTGLTGMDLVRLALERSASAREALERITRLLDEPGQGGGCGHRHRAFRYHNAFLIADPEEAWVLETAGPFWAAERVRGVRTISNVLSIDQEPDLMHAGAFAFAKEHGFCRSTSDFSFARAFGHPLYRVLSGGEQRRALTQGVLEERAGHIGRDVLFAALRSHGGRTPSAGWRMQMPCAHASFVPTRTAGQTTASLVCRLSREDGVLAFATGTSSPCLSVFKPIRLGGERLDSGPAPKDGYDDESLFWRHERLHRAVLEGYDERRALFEDERRRLEACALANEASPPSSALFAEHRQAILEWTARVEAEKGRGNGPFAWWWRAQSRKDGVPQRRR